MKKRLSLFLTLFIVGLFSLQVQAITRYVAVNGSGSGNSWADASGDLQAMIDVSTEGDIILVKAGTYYTSETKNFISGYHTTNYSAYLPKYRTFLLKKGVKIYGGCVGNESDPSQRTNIAGNITTLSGLLQGTSLSAATRYAYHVVIGLGDMTGTVLDGFTIQDGFGYVGGIADQKNGTSIVTAYDGSGNYTIQHLHGGGIYLSSLTATSITLDNLVVQNNNATGETSFGSVAANATYSSGGGIYSNKVSINFGSLTVNNSSAIRDGGGIYMTGGATLTGNTLSCSNNFTAYGNGAGVCIDKADEVNIKNMILSSNAAYSRTEATIGYCNGGGLYFQGNGASSKLIAETITASNNIIGLSGSGLFLSNVYTINISDKLTIKDNKSKSGNTVTANGVGVYVLNSSVNGTSFILRDAEITGNTNSHNTASSSSTKHGAGLFIENMDEFTVTGTFTASDNVAKDNGGGLYTKNVNTITIPSLYLSSNTATRGNGGGMFVESTKTFQVSGNITALSNSALTDGGGMYYNNVEFINTPNVIVGGTGTNQGNTATNGHGGGIYIAGVQTLTPFNSLELYGNKANSSNTSRGGGLFLSGAYGSTTLQATTLKADGNTAMRDGGGIYTTGIKTIKITNLSLDNNSANYSSGTGSTNYGDGGGFYAASASGALVDVFEIENLVSCKGNLALRNGGAFYNKNITSFEIINPIETLSIISGNKTKANDGGFIYNEATNFRAPKIMATSNTAGSNGGAIAHKGEYDLIFNEFILTNNTAGTNGGGIYVESRNTFTAPVLTLTGNTAGTNGGGIYTTGVDNIYITNFSIDSNTAGNGGGGIYTSGTYNNYVNLLDIYKLVSCTGNKANGGSSDGFGGAFFNQYLNTLKFESTIGIVMSDNQATYRGGAMYNNFVNTIILSSESTFTGNKTTNSSSYGGAIYNSNLPSFFANIININGNTSAGAAGGMYSTLIPGTFLINNLTMNSNKATSSNGGGMYFTELRGDITINKIAADGNSSGNSGGTFYFFNNNGNSINLSNAVISNSYSDNNGGGIFIKPQTAVVEFNLYNVELNACKTKSSSNIGVYGGGIYIEDSSSATAATGKGKLNANFTDIKIIGCRSVYGGGMYTGYALNNLNLTTDRLDYNRIEGNTTYNHGTGLHLIHPQGFMKIENTIFERNYGSGIPENPGSGVDGTGGGLYTRAATGSVNNCKFIGNRTYNGGAGFYCAKSNFVLSNLLFEDNYARTAGGGFYMDAGTSAESAATIEYAGKNIVFRNNQSGGGGAAVYATTGTLKLTNAYFIGNTAGTNGGAIHADDGKTYLYFYNAHFQGNTAADRGGCFYVGGTLGNYVFVNSLFAGNTSNNGRGSVVYYSGLYCAQGTYVNCTFADNYANSSNATSTFGCPVNSEASTGYKDIFYNCIFHNNRYQGGIRDYALPGYNASTRTTFTNCRFTDTSSYGASLNYIDFTNVTTGDPLFQNSLSTVNGASTSGDYHLKDGSPCIDAGNNGLFTTEYNSRWSTLIGMYDLDMYDRIQDAAIDLGPYEERGNSVQRNMWYGTVSTDWNTAANWLENAVPDNNEDIRFHPNAIRDLLVPATHYADGKEITVASIYNPSGVNLVLNSRKINVTGSMDFNTASGKIDARQTNSHLSLMGGSGVEQDITRGMLIRNAVYDLTIDRTDDLVVDNLRILRKLNVINTGRLDAASASIFYGLGSEDYSTVNDDRTYIPATAAADKSAYTSYPTEDVEEQVMDNEEYKNETIYNLIVDNSKGLEVRNGIGPADIVIVTNDLTINQGKKMTIVADAGMEVKDMVYNEAGENGLILKTEYGINSQTGRLEQTKPHSSFIFYNPESYPVEATVEYFSKAYYDPNGATGYKYKWQYFTIPVRNAATLPYFTGSYLREWNERADHTGGTPFWKPLDDTSVLESFGGYEITQAAPTVYTIKGILENRDFDKVFTNTVYDPQDHEGWDDQVDFGGHHVIGNPYMAAIDATKIEFGRNFEETVFLFHTGSYADWVNYYSSSLEGDNEGQYISIPKNSAPSLGISTTIAPMQGFVVKIMKKGQARSVQDDALRKSYADMVCQNKDRLRSDELAGDTIFTVVNLTSEHCKDRLWILINDECTSGFDNGWDGSKFPDANLAAQIFTIQNESGSDEYFQIDARDDINDTYIGFKANENDREYTLTFDHKNIDLLNKHVYLTDLHTNRTVDITQTGSSYTFTSQQGENSISKRFRITTEPNVSTGLIDTKETEKVFHIYTEDKEAVIENRSGATANVFLYNAAGVCVAKKNIESDNTERVGKGLPSGVYVIKVSTSKHALTKSIIL